MVLLLLNNGTMSIVHDIYSALCNLQSAFLSLDPENKPAGGCVCVWRERGDTVVPMALREVKQPVQGHTARRQQNQAVRTLAI